MNALDKVYIGICIRAARVRDDVKEFLSEQSGVSNVVATIIVLLITVLLIAAFWKQLQKWLQEDIMDKIFGTKFDSSGLK